MLTLLGAYITSYIKLVEENKKGHREKLLQKKD